MTKRTLLQIMREASERRRAGHSVFVSLASSMNGDDWQVVCCFYPAQARHGAGQFLKKLTPMSFIKLNEPYNNALVSV